MHKFSATPPPTHARAHTESVNQKEERTKRSHLQLNTSQHAKGLQKGSQKHYPFNKRKFSLFWIAIGTALSDSQDPSCGRYWTATQRPPGSGVRFCFTKAKGQRSHRSSLNAPWSLTPYPTALTRLQSPGIPLVLRGQPVFSSNVLTRLPEWFRCGGPPADRACSTSVRWLGLQVPLLSWVEGLSVSAAGTRLRRRNNGTPNTGSFAQKHISTLPLPPVGVWWSWVACRRCKLVIGGISVVKGENKGFNYCACNVFERIH